MTKVIKQPNNRYSLIINGTNVGTLEKSEVRQIIQILDNGIYQ